MKIDVDIIFGIPNHHKNELRDVFQTLTERKHPKKREIVADKGRCSDFLQEIKFGNHPTHQLHIPRKEKDTKKVKTDTDLKRVRSRTISKGSRFHKKVKEVMPFTSFSMSYK